MALKLPFPADLIVETIREPLLVLSADLRVLQANPSFLRTFQVPSEQTHGRVLFDLGNGQWDIPSLRALLDGVIHQNATFDDYEVSHEFPSLGRKIMLLNARRVVGSIEERPVDAILLAIEDVTEQRAIDRRRQQSEDRVKAMMAGFQTHLAKPVDQNELIATIAAITRLSGPEPTP